jgi:glycerol kinase
MSACVLVLDQGGHSTRAIVFDTQGNIIAQAKQPVATQIKQAGWVEQNPAEITQSLWQVLADIATQMGARCADISSAALIVQRSSLLAVNTQTGEPLSAILSWQDTRYASWLDKKLSACPFNIRKITGLHPNAHYGASKMRWLLDTMPAVQQAAQNNTLCLTPLAGYLCQQLTGRKHIVVDTTIASRTLLTELSTISWSPALLDFFAIPNNVLPDISSSYSDYGNINVGHCAVPLQLMGGDQSFILFSHPKNFLQDSIFINAGTGAFLQQVMPASHIQPTLLASALCVEQQLSIVVAEGTVNAAATALDALWQQEGVIFSSVDWHDADKKSQQTADDVPIYINRVTASGSPDWLPAGESYFSFAATVPMKAIAVLESIVFSLQRKMDALAAEKSSKIVLSGGLSRLDVFCQRLSDLSGKVVWRSNDAEASARGAAAQLLPSVVGEPIYCVFAPQQCVQLAERYQQWSERMNQLAATKEHSLAC